VLADAVPAVPGLRVPTPLLDHCRVGPALHVVRPELLAGVPRLQPVEERACLDLRDTSLSAYLWLQEQVSNTWTTCRTGSLEALGRPVDFSGTCSRTCSRIVPGTVRVLAELPRFAGTTRADDDGAAVSEDVLPRVGRVQVGAGVNAQAFPIDICCIRSKPPIYLDILVHVVSGSCLKKSCPRPGVPQPPGRRSTAGALGGAAGIECLGAVKAHEPLGDAGDLHRVAVHHGDGAGLRRGAGSHQHSGAASAVDLIMLPAPSGRACPSYTTSPCLGKGPSWASWGHAGGIAIPGRG